jgi:hypothetical protein
VLEGHGYPLVFYNESKHNILVLIVGKANKDIFETARTNYQVSTGVGPIYIEARVVSTW